MVMILWKEKHDKGNKDPLMQFAGQVWPQYSTPPQKTKKHMEPQLKN